ncbi:hypothetical protein FOZ63_024898, partial [Perkinsus olseni]
ILHLCNGLRPVWQISEMACSANLSMTTECLENLVAIGVSLVTFAHVPKDQLFAVQISFFRP